MPETLIARQGQDGRFYLVDAQTMQPVQPKYPFEKPFYNSNEEAVAVGKQRVQMGMQEQPGLGQLNPQQPPAMTPDGVPMGQPMRMQGVMP